MLLLQRRNKPKYTLYTDAIIYEIPILIRKFKGFSEFKERSSQFLTSLRTTVLI